MNDIKGEKTLLTFDEFSALVKTAHKNGEHYILIWKSEVERERCGKNEEKMIVNGVWAIEGISSDGEPYGQDANMELPYAIEKVLEYNGQFRLASLNGNGIAAMGFKIENLLANEGHMMYAHRRIFFRHLNGPIVSIPSCRIVFG